MPEEIDPEELEALRQERDALAEKLQTQREIIEAAQKALEELEREKDELAAESEKSRSECKDIRTQMSLKEHLLKQLMGEEDERRKIKEERDALAEKLQTQRAVIEAAQEGLIQLEAEKDELSSTNKQNEARLQALVEERDALAAELGKGEKDGISLEELEGRMIKFREKESKPSAPAPPKPAVPRPAPPAPGGSWLLDPPPENVVQDELGVPRPAPRPAPGSSIPGRPMPMPRRTNPLAEEIRKRKEMEARRAAATGSLRKPKKEEELISDLIEKYRGRIEELDEKKDTIEKWRILVIIKELERLREIEQKNLPVRPRHEKKSGLKSAVVYSLFALALGISGTYYWLRGGSGEEPVKPKTPVVKTVPKLEYENLHRELSAEIAKLKSEREKLYTKEQVDTEVAKAKEGPQAQLDAVEKEIGKLTEILEKYQALGSDDDFRAAQQRVSELEEALKEKKAEGNVKKEVADLVKERNKLAAKLAIYTALGTDDDFRASKQRIAELEEEVKKYASLSERSQKLAEKYASLSDRNKNLAEKAVGLTQKLKHDKTLLQGKLFLDTFKECERIYQERLKYDPDNKRLRESLKVTQQRIAGLEPLLKENVPTERIQLGIKTLIDELRKGREQTEEEKLENQIQDLYAKIGDSAEISYALSTMNFDLGVRYEEQGNLEYAKLSYLGAKQFYEHTLACDKNHSAAKKGLEAVQQKLQELECDLDKLIINRYRFGVVGFCVARLAEERSDKKAQRKSYDLAKSSYEATLSKYKDFLPAKIGLGVVQKRISELGAQMQEQQSDKK